MVICYWRAESYCLAQVLKLKPEQAKDSRMEPRTKIVVQKKILSGAESFKAMKG